MKGGAGWAAFICDGALACGGAQTAPGGVTSGTAAGAIGAPIEEARAYDANVTAFMLDDVVPKLAQLLAQRPFAPSTGLGFGCFGCHPAK